MPGNERVTVALLRAGKARNAVFAAQLGKARAAAGQQLVGVALVADVKQKLVLREIQHAMQGNRQFDYTEVRRQMAAGLGNAFNQKLPDFLTQGGHISHRQVFYLPGRIDALQQRIAHRCTSFFTPSAWQSPAQCQAPRLSKLRSAYGRPFPSTFCREAAGTAQNPDPSIR